MRTHHMIPFVWNSRIKTNVYWQKADQWLPEAKSGVIDLEEGHRETVYLVLVSSGLFVCFLLILVLIALGNLIIHKRQFVIGNLKLIVWVELIGWYKCTLATFCLLCFL